MAAKLCAYASHHHSFCPFDHDDTVKENERQRDCFCKAKANGCACDGKAKGSDSERGVCSLQRVSTCHRNAALFPSGDVTMIIRSTV